MVPTTSDESSPIASAGVAVQHNQHQRDIINRLRRIEGQVRALAEMVEAGRPCEEIAQQMSASRKAMEKAFYRMMACSMLEAVSQGQSIEGVERSTRILEKYA